MEHRDIPEQIEEDWTMKLATKGEKMAVNRAVEYVLEREDTYFTAGTDRTKIMKKALARLKSLFPEWKKLTEAKCVRHNKKWEAIRDRVNYRFKNLSKLNLWLEKEKPVDVEDIVAEQTQEDYQ